VSLLTLLSNSGVVQAFGGSVTPLTFNQWLAATHGGGGPTRYWPMSDLSGSTMAASLGGINGVYQNTSDLELNITDAQSAKWVGFGGAQSSPGHATIATPLQSLEFTALLLVQFDLVKAKHILLTTAGGSTPGQFSFEVVDDGAGGLKPRVWSVNDSNQAVIYVGTSTGSIPVGTPCALFYVRRANGTQEVWRVTADGTASQIGLTLDNGTPPGSWSAHPTGTWYVGAWSNLADPLNGVARSLALWNVALAASDINALGSIDPKIQNIVWARDVDAGEVEVSGTRDNIALTPHVHPEVGFTPSIVTQGSLGTYGLSGQVLTYAAGSTPGLDTQGQYKITKGGIDSPTRGLTIEVTSSAASPDLPFFGQYYGAAPFGYAAGNSNTNVSPLEFFFYAQRTGTLTHFRYQRRTGSGYSEGDGGLFTVSVYPADPSTKRRVPGSTAVSQLTGYAPGNPGDAQAFLTVGFSSTPGQVIAKQPYVLHWQNTHANPGSNYFGTNAVWVWPHQNGVPEPGPSGGSLVDPRNVGSSVVGVRGWVPVWIDGDKEMYPYPTHFRGGVSRYHGEALMGVRYSDGIWVGFDFMAAENNFTFRTAIDGSAMGRVRFRVSRATRIVNGLFIRVSRRNSSGGNLLVTLESGPASDTSGNGTLIEQVSVPATVMFSVGSDEAWGENEKVHWIWVPFTQNRTLTLGQLYNLRLSSSGGAEVIIWCHNRADSYFAQGSVSTWDEWEANRIVDWSAWEDSRWFQRSTNGGSTWAAHRGRAPILFRCV
jgi:hypothetical protein